MLELEPLLTRLLGDATSYNAMLSGARAATTAAMRGVHDAAKQIETINKSLQSFAKSTVGVLGMLGAATSLKGAFDRAVELERGQVRLAAAIEANGRAAGPVVQDYVKFADAMAALTMQTKGSVLGLLQQAEAAGVQGDSAKRAVKNAIALAAAKGGEAESYLRATEALEEGSARALARSLPVLKAIEDESEQVARAQTMLANMFRIAEAEVHTTAGQLGKLKKSLGGLTADIGAFVLQAVRPMIDAVVEAVAWFKALRPELQRTATRVVGVALAFMFLGPALSLVSSLLGPMKLLWTALSAAVALVLSPVGLVTAAVATLAVVVMQQTGAMGSILQWFGSLWDDMLEHVGPAIQGVKDAIKAGEIELAFQIVWAQVKLTFVTATQSLRETWIAFIAVMKTAWVEASSFTRTVWERAVTSIAKAITWLGEKLRIFSETEAQYMREYLQSSSEENIKDIEKQRVAGIRAAEESGAASMRAVQDEIRQLTEERDELVAQAADAAAKVVPKKKPELPPLTPPKLPPVEVKMVPKFDAAAMQSAEARSRIAEWAETARMMAFPETRRGEIAGGKAAAAPAAGTAGTEALGKMDEQTDWLKTMSDKLTEIGGKLGLTPNAGL